MVKGGVPARRMEFLAICTEAQHRMVFPGNDKSGCCRGVAGPVKDRSRPQTRAAHRLTVDPRAMDDVP